ncbi:MAG: hypothetical protein QXR62_04595 [Candidatus Bathyarchaeia archaeon]
MPQVDCRKAVSYPPEIIPFAQPIDLLAGDNKVFEYSGFEPYIVSLYGVSFARTDNLNFRVTVDDRADALRFDNLGAVRGIDHTEEVKIPAYKNIRGYIYTPSNITSFQMRHTVRVDKQNALLKLQLGFPLSSREQELASKFDIYTLIQTEGAVPFCPYCGVERIYTYTKVLSSSGAVLRLPVPDGYKAVLLDVAMERPASANQAKLTLERDRQGYDVFELDPYCMQGLSQPLYPYREHALRIVCLEEMLVELSVASGTHKVRLVVGLGKLTIPEKIKWGVELTSNERTIADKLNLWEQVEAGLR